MAAFAGTRARCFGALAVALVTLLTLTLFAPAARAADAPCSDLLVESLSIAPSPTTVGATTTVSIVVRNAGTCATPAFVVQWRQDRFAPTGSNQQVPTLGPGATTTVALPFIFTAPGNFLTAVELDTENAVLETNEVNNLEIAPITVAPAQADLIVTSITATPTPAVQRSVTKIDVTVQNAGNLAAGAFTVELSPGAFLAPLRTQVNALAAGASTVVTFTQTYPSPGDVTVTASADTTSVVPEANEFNNSRSRQLTVVAATIDLVVSGLSVAPDPVVQGRLAHITVKVRNDGNSPAGGFTTLIKPAWWLPDLTTFVPTLDPGQEISRTIDFTFPFAGTYNIRATADSTGAVGEINELNNARTLDVVVEPPLPDLEIADVNVVPVSPVSGLNMRADITVVNSGNDPAGAFLVQWKPWFFGPDLAQQVNGLAVGESKVVSIEYSYPFPGTFDSTITVDPGRSVAEVSETNNTVTEPVVVQTPFVDLVMVDLEVQPGGLAADQPATAQMTIRNDGNAPAGPFLVTWKPSPFVADRNVPVSSLAPGETKVVEATYTYGTAGQLVTTIATVDSTNQIAESNETNNSIQKQVDVSPVGPDLVITNITVLREGSVTQGVPITVRATLQNIGARDAGPFQYEWNPAVPFELITQGPATLSTQLPGLAAGATTTVDFTYAFPAHGNFRTVGRVDAFSNVVETNEANNLKILNLTVAPGIDLSITSFTVVPAKGSATTIERTRDAVAHITVRNNGFFPARNFSVAWEPTGPNPGFFSPSKAITELLPGDSVTVDLTSTYSATGTFTSGAKVDAFNGVTEFNEGNNTATASVVVVPLMSVLQVTLTTISVINDGDDSILQGTDAEWDPIVFGAVNPGSNCNLSAYGQSFALADVACLSATRGGVDSGETLTMNQTIEVHLPEFLPLIVALIIADRDNTVVGPDFPDFRGSAFFLSFRPDFLKLTAPQKLEGQGCTDNNGRCFDAFLEVKPLGLDAP